MLRVGRGKSEHDQTEAASKRIDEKKLYDGLLPDELVVEILSWLPPEFVGRCKIVCKMWREIIQSRDFIEQHMQRQEFFMVYPDLPLEQQPLIPTFSLRGLLLEQNMIEGTYRIRNYATNQVFQLPDLKERRIYSSICHLPSSDEYKVLNFHWKQNGTNIGLVVLTKGTDVTWRCVEVPSLLSCYNLNDYKNVYIRTVASVTYIIKLAKVSKTGSKMMAFQAEDESFVEISLPRSVEFCTGPPFVPMKWDFHMAFARIVGEEVCVWVLQDYKTSKWEARKIVFSSALVKRYPCILRFTPESVFYDEVLVLNTSLINTTLKVRQFRYNSKTQKICVVKRMGHRIKSSLVTS